MNLDLPSLEIAAIRELASIDQWVCWKLEGGRKIPKQPSGLNASSTNPETWRRFDECAQAVVSKGMTGLGFVFSAEDDLVGIDFDHVLDESGAFKDPAIQAIVRGLDSYTERSPSGDGLHVWLRGAIPSAIKIEPIEIYTRGRYFTITGQHVPGFRETIEWREAEIAKLYADLRGPKEGAAAPEPAGGSVKAGSRNNTLTTEAGRLVRAGFREDRLLAALRGLNQGICDPALPDSEVETIVRSASAWEGPRAADPEPDPRLETFTLASFDPKPVRWLWQGRIPRGKIVILDGDPGVGKSTILADLAARVSRGGAMPDGTPTVGGAVVIMTAEDDAADTVRPRVEAAGGDLERVHFVDVDSAIPSITEDSARILDMIRRLDARLLIVDPFATFAGAKTSSKSTTSVSQALIAVKQAAAEGDCTVILVRHLNKDVKNGKALYRGTDSIAIIGTARAGLIAGRDPEDPTRCVLAVTKANLAPQDQTRALAYRIVSAKGPVGETSSVEWLGGVDWHADEIVGAINPGRGGAKESAAEWLRSELASGPRLTLEIQAAAEAAGHAWRTVKRAKDEAGVTSKRRFDGRWELRLKGSES